MSSGYLSVAEAAAALGVHPQRIHQRIRDGSLPAEKIGKQWAIALDDLRRVANHGGPGRPLSSKSAWDLIAVAAGHGGELNPSARSRARSRLRDLIARVEDPDLDLDPSAAAITNALRNRAARTLHFASPLDLPDLRDDPRVHLAGLSLRESNMADGAIVEAYVAGADLNEVVDGYMLGVGTRRSANVYLHVVSADVPGLGDYVRSPLVLAADLAEHDGAREKIAAVRAVASLREQFIGPARG